MCWNALLILFNTLCKIICHNVLQWFIIQEKKSLKVLSFPLLMLLARSLPEHKLLAEIEHIIATKSLKEIAVFRRLSLPTHHSTSVFGQSSLVLWPCSFLGGELGGSGASRHLRFSVRLSPEADLGLGVQTAKKRGWNCWGSALTTVTSWPPSRYSVTFKKFFLSKSSWRQVIM